MKASTSKSMLVAVLGTGLVASLLSSGCGGSGDDDRPRYGELGTTARCNDGQFSLETVCSQICSDQGGVKEWYVNCGQEGQGPTSPPPGGAFPWPPITPTPAGGNN